MPPVDFAARLARWPRLGLAHLPTPLEPMPRLSAHLGGPRLWVKRDDCTGLGLGGNKVRKLDVVLKEALSAGADALVSGGVVQSNSVRQVAAAAAKLGLQCHLAVFHGRVAPPNEEYGESGNVLLNRLFGAVLHPVPWTGDRNAALVTLLEKLRSEGRKPFLVPYGVSNVGGAIGAAGCAVEIATQAEAAGFRPKAVVFASGSSGTQAGLAVAGSAVMRGTEIVGIDIDAEPERVRADVVALSRATAARLDLPFDETSIEVVAGYAGPAYGVIAPETLEALSLGARLEGLVLDPVYSGKALAGLMAFVRRGRWQRGDDVVFVHTGGSPALFAYRSALSI